MQVPMQVPREIEEIQVPCVLQEIKVAEMLRQRVRYFTAGAVIGSMAFVNEVFTNARERFSAKRTDGARSMKGNASAAKGVLWSMRDLQV